MNDVLKHMSLMPYSETYIVNNKVSIAVELSCFTDLNNLDLRGVNSNLD